MLTFTQFSKEILESGDIDPDYHFMRQFAKRRHLTYPQLLIWIKLKVSVYRSTEELKIMLGYPDGFPWARRFEQAKFGQERNKAKHKAYDYYSALGNYIDSFPPPRMHINVQHSMQFFHSIGQVNGIGPWARWKLIDLLDCVYGCKIDLSWVDFREAYEFPLKGLMAVNGWAEDVDDLEDDEVFHTAMKTAWRKMPKVKKTPHNNNGGVRINEFETCLCKYHSYIHGHYYPGKDIEHLRADIAQSELKQLKGFVWSI